MPFQIKIDAEEQKNSFLLFDCTGIYRFDNLTGWNAPNPDMKRVTSAILSVWPPGISLSSQPYQVDLTGKFPNPDFLGIEILPHQVGQVKNEMESGSYTIRMDVKGIDKKGIEYCIFAVIRRVFVNTVTCCVDHQQKNVDKNIFKDKKQQAIVEMNNLLESTNYAITHELYEEATEMVNLLKAQCVCNGC